MADETNKSILLPVDIEAEFMPRRFTNAADAFDTVKAFAIERANQ